MSPEKGIHSLEKPVSVPITAQTEVVSLLPSRSHKNLYIGIAVFVVVLVLWFISFIGREFYLQTKDTKAPLKDTQTLVTSSTTKQKIETMQSLSTNEIPDLSTVDNLESKKLIEKYYIEIKPIRDEIQKQIPKEGVVFKGGSANISMELLKKWNEVNDSVYPILKKLSELNKEHDTILVNISVTSAKVKLYVNDVFVSEITSEDSNFVILEIYNATDYRSYIKLGNKYDNGFVLKKGINEVKVVYDIPKKTTAVPITVTFNASEVTSEGVVSSGDELLKIEENSSRVVNGIEGKKAGELTGTFILN